MTKRTNPFTDDFIPQSKKYIRLNHYNNNEDSLKKVYEKTLDLLFKGAKKSYQPDATNVHNANYNRKDNMKQLFIGKEGNLQHSGTLVEDCLVAKLCKCGGQLEQQCEYCEAVLCQACQNICSQCKQTFCKACLLFRSEGLDVCVSCYS